mmetsp:Transcript_82861/g.215863  ORF Transcript_82861/g.215863 Transcript_82861/m.215863 type:complete len:358 (+) Transcript_82861:2-1075(+)
MDQSSFGDDRLLPIRSSFVKMTSMEGSPREVRPPGRYSTCRCRSRALGGATVLIMAILGLSSICVPHRWSSAFTDVKACQRELEVALTVAFVGNSFTYYNDLPHLVQGFLAGSLTGNATSVKVGACLHGGQSLESVWAKGARLKDEAHIGGHDMFPTVRALLSDACGWDVVVLQDYSSGPALQHSRAEGLKVLSKYYEPLLLQNSGSGRTPLVVLYQTWGYRKTNKKNLAIREFDNMTLKLEEGYRTYADQLRSASLEVAVAPAGQAFKRVHDASPDLWWNLYQSDDKHPTAVGSYLNGAHIATAIVDHPRFRGLFGAGLKLQRHWPAEVKPYDDAPPPSDTDLQRVLALAGPGVVR